jgi:arylsulfatase A-like enzyme
MADGKRPNILMMVNDHEAFYRHGWDGGARPQRPALQRLASGGVRFDRAYTACPLCTPARRSLMTGMLPHNHGYLTLDPAENGPERTFGDIYTLLGQQGYDLNYFGKWHAGTGTAKDYGCNGFSYPEFGNPYVTREYAAYCRRLGISEASFDLEHVFLEPVSPDQPTPGPGYRCTAPHFHPHVTGVMETESEGHESAFLAHLACNRLEELAEENGDRPFFVRVDFYGPHAPYLVSQEFLDLYSADEILEYGSFRDELHTKPAVYQKEWNSPFGEDHRITQPSVMSWSEWQRILRYVYAHVTQVDAAGGKVLDALERLGLAEDTLVIWTTDHGDPIAAHGGHFGKESFLSEESARIPFAMRWPGHISSDQHTDALVSQVDVPVTLLEAAGTSFTGPVDGRSLFGLIDESGTVRRPHDWRDAVMVETHGHHWEKVVGRALITERYHYAAYAYLEQPDFVRDGDWTVAMEELYDLERDPYQLTNLAKADQHAAERADARSALREARIISNDRYPLDLAE